MTHNSLLQDSLIPTSSLLRRKSMLCLSTSNTSLSQNDDDAERLERRRTAEIEMRQRDNVTPPSSDKRKLVGGSIAGLTPAQLAEHYANCIKLSAENKINTKNAFSLQLIDYMAMMLKKRDSKMDNFQVASCTLDASTKIYAYRVDSVHTDVLKMAVGLAAGSRKKNMNEVEEQGDGGEGDHNSEELLPSLRRKRSRKPKNTIANNIETLNAKPDLDYGKNLFFLQSVGNLDDCQPGGCHFLSSLKVRNDCSLMLCPDLPYWDPGDNNVPQEDVIVPLPPIPDLRNKSICSAFSQFRFTSWSLDADEEKCNSSQIPPVFPDDDFAFDMNAVPEPVPVCDNDLAVENFQESDDGLDSDGEEVPVACAPAQRSSAARIVDLRKHLSTSPSEYSYFRAGALELWAGPSHWKYKYTRLCDGKRAKDDTEESTSNKKRKSKQKKEEIITFESNDSCMMAIESNKESLKLTKRTVEKVWCAQKNTFPPDVHFDCKNFQELQIRRLVGVGLDSVPVEDKQTSVYDYENDHDTTEYCPNINLADDVNDADDGPSGEGEEFLVGQHQDVHTSLAMEGTTGTYAGDNLVVPPNKVARIFIPYAQRAKAMDMKKLKAAIWEILVNAEKCQEIKDHGKLKVEETVKFSYLYSCLPSHLPSNLANNLSAQLTLVALLHLANEKKLHIEGKENLDDLIISHA